MWLAVTLTFSTTVWTAEPVIIGNLRVFGVVLINSTPTSDGATPRSGDTITTGAGRGIILSPVLGRIEVRSDTEVRLEAGRVELARGAVAASRLPVAVRGFTIQPQNGTGAWYAVARRDGRVVVAAHRGKVLITSLGVPPVVVAEGCYADREDSQPTSPDTNPPTESKQKKGMKRPARSSARAATAGGWAVGGLSHAASVALVVGVGAGVAAVTAGAAVTLNESGPSPDD